MGIFEPSPEKLVIVLIIALIVLGPKRLPEVGKSLGKGIREFKDGITRQSRVGARRPRTAPGSEHHAASGLTGLHAADAERSGLDPDRVVRTSQWLALAESIPRTSSR